MDLGGVFIKHLRIALRLPLWLSTPVPRSPLGVLQRRASNFIAPKYGSVRAGVLTLTFSAVGSGILGLPCAGAPRVDALLHVSPSVSTFPRSRESH